VQSIFPVASLVLTLILFLALPWIIWRSLKFNMRMSSFSTVRFGFDGTVGKAYVAYLLWPLLFFFSLALGPICAIALSEIGIVQGVAAAALAVVVSLLGFLMAFFVYASMTRTQTRYQINGYRFGQGHFHTKVRTQGFAIILMKATLFAILIAIVILALSAVAAFATGIAPTLLSMIGNLDNPEALQSAMSGGLFAIIIALYIGMLVGFFLFAAYLYTSQRSYILGNTKLDGHTSFTSTLKTSRLTWVMITNLLLIAITLGLAIPWTRTRMARLIIENTQVDVSTGFDAYVSAQQSEQSSLGEQLGDAFDVDVGVGF